MNCNKEGIPLYLPLLKGIDRSLRKRLIRSSEWPFPAKRQEPTSRSPQELAAQKRQFKIEPIIGHLKYDHRMGRCRYKGQIGGTANVVWARLAWHTKKIVTMPDKWEK
jgi:hypothetical protein